MVLSQVSSTMYLLWQVAFQLYWFAGIQTTYYFAVYTVSVNVGAACSIGGSLLLALKWIDVVEAMEALFHGKNKANKSSFGIFKTVIWSLFALFLILFPSSMVISSSIFFFVQIFYAIMVCIIFFIAECRVADLARQSHATSLSALSRGLLVQVCLKE